MNKEGQNQEPQEKHYTPEERQEYIAELRKYIASNKPIGNKRKPITKIIWYSVLAIACLAIVATGIGYTSSIQELKALVGTLQQQVDERSIQIQKLEDRLAEVERDLQAATSKTESAPETTPSSPKDYPPVDWSKILPQAIPGY